MSHRIMSDRRIRDLAMPSLPLFAISTACPLNSSTLQGGKYNCRGLLRVSPEPAGVYNRPVPMPIRKKVQSRAFRAVKGLSFLLATSVLVLASPARGDDSATEQARQCYETGTQQYDLGHWDDAIREFEKAYQLRPDPSFLYNLAQAYRRKGDTKRALDLYRNYLAKIPKSPQRAEIEERIKTLQKQIDEEASAKSAPPEPTGRAPVPPPALPLGTGLVPAPAEAPATSVPQADPGMTPGTLPSTTPLSPPTDQPSQAAPTTNGTTSGPVPSVADATASPPAAPGRGLRIAGIVCGAVGVAALSTGIVFGTKAKNLSNKVAGASSFNQSDDSAGSRDEKLQWVFYGVGAGVAAAGAALYYFGFRAARTTPSGLSLGPVLGPGTAGVSAMGVF